MKNSRWFLFLALLIRGTAMGQTPAPMKEVNANVFQLGEIQIDKLGRMVTFPAMINMRDGGLEYLLVQEQGKTHESLLSTKVEPSELHVAMLLLGAKDSAGEAKAPPQQIDAEFLKHAPKLQGADIEILVSWELDGRQTQVHAEDLLLRKDKPLPPGGAWIYNGSIIENGRFLAQAEGSIVSLVTDPSALINNERPGCDDDQIWSPRAGKLPPLNTPVNVTFKLLSKDTSK